MPTRWTAQVDPTDVLPEYPRPQLVRDSWQNLNGLWRYVITEKEALVPTHYDGLILVPYPIESALSRVSRALLPEQCLWYERSFAASRHGSERVLLHFGAVDWQATVFVNGKEVGSHVGGYESFSFDITDALRRGENELRVRVFDPTDRGPNPRGKQTLNPNGIMYTAVSGIWQTVWLETVPRTHVTALKITPDFDRSTVDVEVRLSNVGSECTVEGIARSSGSVVARSSGSDSLTLRIATPHAWSPDDPHLYDLEVRVIEHGAVVDQVTSYFGMRKFEVRKDEAGIERIFLNGRYLYNLGTLDQGYWPDGLYTAPTDAALRFDIEAIKAMGFNTIRKHVKIEPARWYYHCDVLGVLVWQDMVQPGGNAGAIPGSSSPENNREFEQGVVAAIAQLHNHPSIVLWTLFNEGWGSFDQARLTALVRQLDPTRLINTHSGANYLAGTSESDAHKQADSDLADAHSYPRPVMPDVAPGKACVLGEYGGVAVFVEEHVWDDLHAGWGYRHIIPGELAVEYEEMINTLQEFESRGLSGSIYTQPYDVEYEQNGLMTYDRAVVKIPIAELRRIHAKLIRATRNSFAASRQLVIDSPDPRRAAEIYAACLAEYDAGNSDPMFVRRLALMAIRQNDPARATRLGNEYIGRLRRPYSRDALLFILGVTRSRRDTGFELLKAYPEEFDAAYVTGAAEAKIKEIMQRETQSQ